MRNIKKKVKPKKRKPKKPKLPTPDGAPKVHTFTKQSDGSMLGDGPYEYKKPDWWV